MKNLIFAFLAIVFFTTAVFAQTQGTPATGKPKAGDIIIVEDSHFENESSAVLTAASKTYLSKLAAAINRTKYASVTVDGYAYDSQNEETNIKFSKDRAKAVAFVLMKSGIPNTKITFHGLGSKMLATNNDTKEGKIKNRRVEIKIK